MKFIPLVLMGCGGVGRQLLQHIVNCRSLHAKQGFRLRVVGVCDSNSLVVASDVFTGELDDTFLLEIHSVKLSGSSLSRLSCFGECQTFTNLESTRKIIDIAALLGRSTGLAFVDCSASSETIGVLNQVVDLGCCIVLANKKPLTSGMEDYEKLVSQPRRIRHESTVGAGLPVIASINRILASGDPIHHIIGSLSGTLGYVMSEVEDGKPFSEVVKTAKCLGYTEPDPRDDLSGMDVARKWVYVNPLYPLERPWDNHGIVEQALILARLLGRKINLDSISVQSLYPDEMGPTKISVQEFMDNGIPMLDNDIKEKVEVASSNGNVLRYVCMIDGSRCQVGIQELPKDSSLGRLRGSDNVLEIYSRCYSKLPLVIQGAGAGNDTTAAGVLADIIDIQDLFP